MWDENRPMKLIGALRYDSVAMQHIIDTDKYIEGDKLGTDLCGSYAPFCRVCNKADFTPCATAYEVSERMDFVCPLIRSTGLNDAEVIQKVIDMDKLVGSEKLGVDLCGRYAPFCKVCDKQQHSPCGNAYLRYMAVQEFSTKALTEQSGGQLVVNAPRWDDALTQALEEVEAQPSEEVAEQPVQPEQVAVPEQRPARGFRIGIARRHRSA